MKEHTISRIAIYILSLVMLVFGINHFTHPKDLLVYVPPTLPGGIVWVYVVGIAFILAAIAFVSNRLVKVAAYMLALLLFVLVITVHLSNYLHAGDVEMKHMAMFSILKDSALAAFALHIGSNAKTVG